jgi:hypothetical protein
MRASFSPRPSIPLALLLVLIIADGFRRLVMSAIVAGRLSCRCTRRCVERVRAWTA